MSLTDKLGSEEYSCDFENNSIHMLLAKRPLLAGQFGQIADKAEGKRRRC